MALTIVKYGDPVLREKGARIEAISPEIDRLIDDMFLSMHEAEGIGLAAQQVGRALQLTVIDVRDVTDRPSSVDLNGQPAEVNQLMPLVLINPEIEPTGDPATGPEGCLSFPEIYADITRPASVHVKALNRKGEPIAFKAGGLLSRAIQHEVDHLNGILFIDRMNAYTKLELKSQLATLREDTLARLRRKKK